MIVFGFQEWSVRRRIGDAQLMVTADMRLVEEEAKDTARQRRLIRLNECAHLPGLVKRLGARVIYETSSFRFGEGDISPRPIETTSTYRRMSDVWEHRGALDQSRTFAEIRKSLETSGRFRHKKYEITQASDAIDLIKACYLDILLSMEAHGYDAGRKTSFATGGIGHGLIDRLGRLVSGPAATHRKAAAKIVGLEGGFPLRISGIHGDWLRAKDIRGSQDLGRLPGFFPDVVGVVPGR